MRYRRALGFADELVVRTQDSAQKPRDANETDEECDDKGRQQGWLIKVRSIRRQDEKSKDD